MPPKIAQRARRKRLIILCDGTWQDSTTGDADTYPTNVTRLSRALSRNGRVFKNGAVVKNEDGNDETMEQVVFYQKGVGTGLLDRFVGGATGMGVSAHVRAAYAFLAHNYEDGDQIFVFGFSRGAYTARSVAAMVARYGLLTPLGMDQFPLFYNAYYKFYANNKVPNVEGEKAALAPLLKRPIRLRQSASNAVKIVGVWDTVGAVSAWASPIISLFGGGSEQNETLNQDLPERISFAFQALALDEKRRMYQPMLWHLPKTASPDKFKSPNPELNDVGVDEPTVEMKQVWFSGVHSDIGGGYKDSHLADITLAWMIAECAKTRLLEFEDDYLLIGPEMALDVTEIETAKSTAWSTIIGPTKQDSSLFSKIKYTLLHLAPKDRIPLSTDSSKAETNEYIHASVNSRIFAPGGLAHSELQPQSIKGEAQSPVAYISGNLTSEKDKEGWLIKSKKLKGRKAIPECEVLPMEYKYKGRIRNAEELPIVSLSKQSTMRTSTNGESLQAARDSAWTGENVRDPKNTGTW